MVSCCTTCRPEVLRSLCCEMTLMENFLVAYRGAGSKAATALSDVQRDYITKTGDGMPTAPGTSGLD
jgi:hypothetical protein